MRKLIGAVLVLVASSVSGQQDQSWCATPRPAAANRDWFQEFASHAGDAQLQKAPLRIPVAFHVVTDGRNGLVSLAVINVLIGNLNWAYRDTQISFYLYSADSIRNKGWYNSCVFNTANMQKLRKRMAKDVRYYVNVYSCKLGKPQVYGISTFPPGYPIPNPGNTYLQGVAIDPVTIGATEQFQYGLALAHEIGHYLGLFHTFETYFNEGQAACSEPGDLLDDTPTQDGDTFGDCPIDRDSCSSLPGVDDIPNFMNYATDACWDHFSPGQASLMAYAIANFRPTLGTR